MVKITRNTLKVLVYRSLRPGLVSCSAFDEFFFLLPGGFTFEGGELLLGEEGLDPKSNKNKGRQKFH